MQPTELKETPAITDLSFSLSEKESKAYPHAHANKRRNNRAAACVILYNPTKDFIDNLKSYIHLVGKTFIVDNSEEVNNSVIEAIKTQFQSDKIHLFINRDNKGLSVPLNTVFFSAAEEGFEIMLTMDQDSSFMSESLFKEAYQILETDETVGLIGMAHYNTRMKRWYKESRNFIFTTETITSGSLVRVSAWKKLLGFDERLFIDNIDNDFCMSLKLAGYQVLQSKTKQIQHDLGETNARPHRFSKKQKIVSLHSPLRSYYITRNSLLFLKKFFFFHPFYGFRKIRHYFLYLKKHYLYSPDFEQHKTFIFRGIKDFFMNKFGKFSELGFDPHKK